MAEQRVEERRGFLTGAIMGMMGAIGAALGVPALGYLFVPGRQQKPGNWIETTDIGKLMVNQPEQVVFQRVRRDGWKTVTEKAVAWLVRTGDQQVVAFSPICTHLGCAVSWKSEDKTFACPCHTSAFSPEGKVLTGPAPRALDRYAVRVDNGKVLIGEIKKAPEA